jgi:hypothetical protein
MAKATTRNTRFTRRPALQRLGTACRAAAEKQVQHLERRIKDPFQRAPRKGRSEAEEHKRGGH